MPKVRSETLAAGLLGIAAGVLACLAPAQSDTWWLLRAGQDIVRTRAIPLVDTYSHTAAGLYWPNHEWLTEVLFYALHQFAGMPALALVCALMIMAGAAISWRLAEGAFEPRFVAFGIALVSSTSIFAIRPQVFTIFAFALACLLLRRNRVWWLPLLVFVWVNFHGAGVLGVVVVGAAAISDLIAERRLPRRLLLATAASAAATLLTPLGWRLWTFIPESTERSRINQLIEWSSPDFSMAQLPFWITAAALLVLSVWRWRRLDMHTLRIVAIALAILPLALQSMRNVPIFFLAALPAVVMLLSAGAAPGRPQRAGKEHETVNGAILLTAGVTAAALVGMIWMRPPRLLAWQPVSAAATRAIHTCGAPLYNTYGRGGELIWFVPQQPVFIDNRQDPYPLELLAASRKLEHDGDYSALFDRHSIQCAVAPPDSVVTRSLRQSSDWRNAFEDAQWAVFTRAAR